MSEPTLQDCINYMRSQIKQMEKHTRNYEFNLPYYRKTVELLETRKTNDEIFKWCHDCKEYDQKEHCCHRWTKVIRDTVDELEKDRRPHGEWIEFTVSTYRGTDEWGEPKWGKGKKFICKRCGRRTVIRENFCPNCGASMRKEGDEK